MALPVSIAPDGKLRAAPATKLTALLAPLANDETVSAFTSVTLTAPPLPVKLTVLKSLLALVRAMSPLPVAVKLLAPLTLLAPD